jgi:hypothetical protein
MRIPLPFLASVAALLPGCGDGFLPKIYPDPSSPAEEDGRPMAPSQDPAIKTLKCEPKTPCGKYTWQVNFRLPAPAATSGWIVQEISYDLHDQDGVHKQGSFWEGFYVEAGETRCVYSTVGLDGSPLDPGTNPELPDDTYHHPGHVSNSMGVDTLIGKAKFYEGTLPGDFIRPNNQTFAIDRRSTTTQPPFWNGTGTDHNLTVTWDCTGGNDLVTMLPIPPDPSVPCTAVGP